MRKHRARKIVTIAAAAAAAVLFVLSRLFVPVSAEFRVVSFAFEYMLPSFVLLLWSDSLWHRIPNLQARIFLVIIGIQLLLLMTIDCLEIGVRSRLWSTLLSALYSVPILLIPVLLFYATLYIGRGGEWRMPARYWFLMIPTGRMILGVHIMAFLQPGHMGRLAALLPAASWILFFMILASRQIYMMSKGRSVKPFAVPAAFLTIGLAYEALELAELLPEPLLRVGMPAVVCVMVIGVIESGIRVGLILSNSHYEELFAGTSLGITVVNRAFQLCYASAAAEPLTEEVMKRALKERVAVRPDMYVRGSAIAGGYAFRQEDVSRQEAVVARLRENTVRLSDSHELMRSELTVKENRARTAQASRIYDMIARELSRPMNRMGGLLEGLDPGRADFRGKLFELTVLGAYCKRKANLLLLRETGSASDARELAFCIRETMDSLNAGGIACGAAGHSEGEVPFAWVLAAYDMLQRILEQALPKLRGFYTELSAREGALTLTIRVLSGEGPCADCSVGEAVKRSGGSLKIRGAGEETIYTLRFPGEEVGT